VSIRSRDNILKSRRRPYTDRVITDRNFGVCYTFPNRCRIFCTKSFFPRLSAAQYGFNKFRQFCHIIEYINEIMNKVIFYTIFNHTYYLKYFKRAGDLGEERHHSRQRPAGPSWRLIKLSVWLQSNGSLPRPVLCLGFFGEFCLRRRRAGDMAASMAASSASVGVRPN
jgi:hypothetical protein